MATLTNNDSPTATLSDSLKLYPGQWVAIRDHQVVAHATELENLREQIRGQQIDRFFRVPQRRQGGGIFL
jgi:uncharacterized protein DUF5678